MSSTTAEHTQVTLAMKVIGAPCSDNEICNAVGLPLLRVRELLDNLVIDDKVTRHGAAPGPVVYQLAEPSHQRHASAGAEPAPATKTGPMRGVALGGNRQIVATMYKDGVSVAAMAARLGISEDGVRYHLKTLRLIAVKKRAAKHTAATPAPVEIKPSISPVAARATAEAGIAQFAFWNSGELQIQVRGSQVRLCHADRAALKQFLHQLPD